MEDSKFEEFVNIISASKDDMPQDVHDQIVTSMRRKYAEPPIEAMEIVLRNTVSVSKARQILFCPNDEDMALYPQLLQSPPAGAPESHPQAKCQILAMTTLYLVHSRAWVRVRPFIVSGGLDVLVQLLTHPNLYIVSQAISCLLNVTDEEMYPWHDAPPLSDGRHPKEGPDAPVWRAMFNLSRGPLLPNLLRHQNPDTFPASGLLALRLLAFFASWLRYHFAPGRVLRMSAGMLELLKDWSQREGCGEEECALAKSLYEDFSRFTPAEAPDAPQLGTLGGGGEGNEGTTLGMGKEAEGDGVRVVHDRTLLNPTASDSGIAESEALKVSGNAAYQRGDYTTAVARYSAALDVPVPTSQLLTEGPRRAVLLTNRAAAYIARADAGGGEPGTSDDMGHLEGQSLGPESQGGEPGILMRHYEAALMDAQAAIDLDPSYPKAFLRQAQALQALGRRPQALAAATKAAHAATAAVAAAPSANGAAAQAARGVERQAQALVRALEVEGGPRPGLGASKGVDTTAPVLTPQLPPAGSAPVTASAATAPGEVVSAKSGAGSSHDARVGQGGVGADHETQQQHQQHQQQAAQAGQEVDALEALHLTDSQYNLDAMD